MYYGVPGQARRLRGFYHQFVSAGDVCFDIGAHVGNRTRALAGLGAQVVALEPQPVFARFLRWAYGWRKNITVLPFAAGAESGRLPMYLSGNAPTVSSLAGEWTARVQQEDHTFSWVRWEHQIEVEVTTLDLLIAQFGMPSFCKIDVEGFESEVLRGLSQPIEFISVEYIRSLLDATAACLKEFERLGSYEFNLTVVEETRLRLSEWVSATALMEALDGLPATATSGDVYGRLVRNG